MSKPEAKKQALALRRSGLSIKEIAEQVGVSKGTASVWVRDVMLTKRQEMRLKKRMFDAGHKGRMIGAESNKQYRLARIALLEKQAQKDISNMSRRDLFFLGLGLYWGEGFKARSTANAGFSNSDHRVILLMITWLQQVLGISRERLRIQIFINDIHRHREKIILKFWRKTTGLPASQFANVVFLPKARKVYENMGSYYGVCAVRVLKGMELKNRIIALIDQSYSVYGQCRGEQ